MRESYRYNTLLVPPMGDSSISFSRRQVGFGRFAEGKAHWAATVLICPLPLLWLLGCYCACIVEVRNPWRCAFSELLGRLMFEEWPNLQRACGMDHFLVCSRGLIASRCALQGGECGPAAIGIACLGVPSEGGQAACTIQVSYWVAFWIPAFWRHGSTLAGR